MTGAADHKTRTLWLCGILHAFTHLYQVALVPLYLLIQRDLRPASVTAGPLLVTVMGLAYFLPSYGMGHLADRFSRKKLLSAGLIINALGFIALAAAPNYPSALVSVMVAGFGGSFFHPSATAMVARLCPVGTGRAFGLVGIGASAGFCFSPLYAGWRATVAHSWRAPVFELGVLGLAMAIIFFWLAKEQSGSMRELDRPRPNEKIFPLPALWFIFLAGSLAFSLRDFAGGGMVSLGSLFLQRAQGFDPKTTGLALSAMYLTSAVSNPLFGGLSDRARLRWAGAVLTVAALMIFIFPRVPARPSIAVLTIYGFFFMASYPMVEAALMESVPDSSRGRVFGIFITVAGLFGNVAHWAAGNWVRMLGTQAKDPAQYFSAYGLFAGLVLLSMLGLPCLYLIRRKEGLAPVSGLGSWEPSREGEF